MLNKENSRWRTAAILKIAIHRHTSVTNNSILIKFSVLQHTEAKICKQNLKF